MLSALPIHNECGVVLFSLLLTLNIPRYSPISFRTCPLASFLPQATIIQNLPTSRGGRLTQAYPQNM